MQIVYVAQHFTADGPKLAGRSLVRHLATEHDVRVCGAIVADDSPLLRGDLADDVVAVSELDTADVVYLEGGWGHRADPEDRLPVEVATGFVRRGGQLIVADVNRNAAQAEFVATGGAYQLLDAVPRYNGRHVQYLYDEGASEGRNTQRFLVSQMRISDWLMPAWDGIDSVLTWGAIDLIPGEAILATGHASTGVLAGDLLVDGPGLRAWASVNGFGLGHTVAIGASVSADYLVEECPDNARWLSNVMTLLVDRSRESAGWRTSRRGPESRCAAEDTGSVA